MLARERIDVLCVSSGQCTNNVADDRLPGFISHDTDGFGELDDPLPYVHLHAMPPLQQLRLPLDDACHRESSLLGLLNKVWVTPHEGRWDRR